MNALAAIVESISFATPELALLILPLVMILIWQLYGDRRLGALQLTGLEYLAGSGIRNSQSRKRLQVAMRCVMVAGLGLLLAGPVYRSATPLFSQDTRVLQRNFVVAFDMSPSMNLPASSKGFGGDDLKEGDGGVTRYEMARDAFHDFLDRFRGERFGLILFSTEPFFARWPTIETENRFDEVLESIRRGSGTQLEAFSSLTNIDKGLLMARKAFNGEEGAIILISDAEDDLENLGRGVRSLRQAGIRLYTLGVGIPDDILARISQEFAADPGFRIFRADSGQDMEEAYRVVSEIEESPQFVDETRVFETDLRAPLAALLAIIAVLLLVINEVMFHQTVSMKLSSRPVLKVSDGF